MEKTERTDQDRRIPPRINREEITFFKNRRAKTEYIKVPMGWNYIKVVKFLRSKANPRNAAGMARFGINPKGTLGVSMPLLRGLARAIRKDKDLDRHVLAGRLWKSGIHEARILAALVEDPRQVTRSQAASWVRDFDSWDVCDQTCLNLFAQTSFAWDATRQWAIRREEFVKRAGFALMAVLAVHDSEASDEKFLRLLPLVRRAASDERNFVKKAVNWALRQIGKRNRNLNRRSLVFANEISRQDFPSARWIAKDAIRELKDWKPRGKK